MDSHDSLNEYKLDWHHAPCLVSGRPAQMQMHGSLIVAPAVPTGFTPPEADSDDNRSIF
jgi:hypothetical protein